MELIHNHIQNLDQSLAEICQVKHYAPNYRFGPHSHQNLEINFVSSGTCWLKFDTLETEFRENDTMIIYPNAEHHFFTGKQKASLVQLEFKVDQILQLIPGREHKIQNRFLDEIKNESRKYLRIINNSTITSVIKRIVDELNNKREGYENLAKLYYAELFILLARHLGEVSKWNETRYLKPLNNAIHLINNSFTHKITINDVASQAGISPRQLRNLFSKYLKESPSQYLMRLRIQKAKELMRESGLPINDIAIATGFGSHQHFTTAFKAATGHSPTQYRIKISL